MTDWLLEDYSQWSRTMAVNYTEKELDKMLRGVDAKLEKAKNSHLSSINRTSSMQSNSQQRSQARNLVSYLGEQKQALKDAIEIKQKFKL